MDKLIALVQRHGQTLLNAENKFRGWTDVALDETGVSQAEAARDFLTRFKIGQIISSPLLRAVTTADIIAQPHGIFVYQHRGLFPLSVGIFTGQDRDKNNDAFRLFVQNPDVKIPEGESLEEFDQRQFDFWKATLESAKNNGVLTLFVAHTSNVTSLENFCEGNNNVEPESGDSVKPGGTAAIYFNAKTKSYKMKPIFGVPEKAQFGAS